MRSMDEYRQKQQDLQAPVRHLIDKVNSVTTPSWSYDGEVIATKGTRQYQLHCTAEWNGRTAKCRLTSQQPFSGFLMAKGSYGEVTSDEENVKLEACDGSWSSPNAHVSLSSWTASAGDSCECQLSELDTGALEQTPRSRGIVFTGVCFEHYPVPLPIEGSRRFARGSGMVTTVFGRQAVIKQIDLENPESDVIIAFDGEALEMLQEASLWLLLSFLSGRRGRVTGYVGFDENKELWRKRFWYEDCAVARRPPISWFAGHSAIFGLADQFPKMLNSVLELINNNARFDIVCSHLFSDSHHDPDVEIRDITLALDTLIESKMFANRSRQIVPDEQFQTIIESLRIPVSETLKKLDTPEDLIERIWSRLREANDRTSAYRRERFWKQVGIVLTTKEKRALKYRNPMSHNGFIPRADDDKALESFLFEVRLARTLVNRTILSLLNYQGFVLDYTSGLMKDQQDFQS